MSRVRVSIFAVTLTTLIAAGLSLGLGSSGKAAGAGGGSFHVNAEAAAVIAHSGNRLNVYICVSVQDGAGPVLGLGIKDFTVDPMVVGPGGALVNITSVSNGRIGGTYMINVVPIRTETWKVGEYIFAVQASHGSDRGLALAKMPMQ